MAGIGPFFKKELATQRLHGDRAVAPKVQLSSSILDVTVPAKTEPKIGRILSSGVEIGNLKRFCIVSTSQSQRKSLVYGRGIL